MATRPLDIYLGDHLGGSRFGADLAKRLAERTAGTPLGDDLARVSREIEEDREALQEIAEGLGTGGDRVKEAGGWLAEKISRFKFNDQGTGETNHGNFLALETLLLGVIGKRYLWITLDSLSAQFDQLDPTRLARLIERADAQIELLELARTQASSALHGGG